MNIKDKLIHAVTEYDRKQSTRKGYNPYALGIYIQRVDEIAADIERGADIRKAIIAGFTGRLVDHCLRSAGLPITTNLEQFGSITYEPVKP